jgi:hypothetical protein
MFKYSKFIADYARYHKYYISSLKFSVWYTLACVVRVIEISLVLAIIWAVCVLILSI